MKNSVKHLYELKISKDATFSKILSKCIKDIFAKKKQGNVAGVKENLQALVHLPQQFGDHAKCFPRFCAYKRTHNQTFSHRS